MIISGLIFLKSLIDFIWTITCIPLVVVILFASIYMFVEASILGIVFDLENKANDNLGLSIQLSILLLFAVIFVIVYCVYLFRKTLCYFQKRNPFDLFIIKTYNRIGNLLVFSGVGATVLFFIFKLAFESKFEIHLGFSPYLFIVCLGLFFMVLSEVFKVAKTAKEENELTI